MENIEAVVEELIEAVAEDFKNILYGEDLEETYQQARNWLEKNHPNPKIILEQTLPDDEHYRVVIRAYHHTYQEKVDDLSFEIKRRLREIVFPTVNDYGKTTYAWDVINGKSSG